MKELDCCVQDHGNSEGLECHLMFIWAMSPEPFDLLQTNLACLCIIMSHNVMWKNWFAVFTVKAMVRACIIKMCLCLLYLLNHQFICNQTWLNSISLLARVSCEKTDCFVQGQVHSEGLKCQ